MVVSLSSGAALRGSPLSGGYAGAKATVKFISAYAAAEVQSRSLAVRFAAVLPMLTPATDLGKVGVATYAQHTGISVEAFQDQLGRSSRPSASPSPLPTSSQTTATRDATYLLTATELSPLT